MRVAYICADPGIPAFGSKGASIHVQEVLRAFLRRGAKVELLCVKDGGPRPSDLAEVGVHVCELPRGIRSQRAREIALAARNDARRQAVERLGPVDLIYERFSLWSYGALEWAQAQGVPSLLEVNAPLTEEQARHRSLNDPPGAEAAAVRALSAASSVVAVSDPVAGWSRRMSRGQTGVHVVPNGVDPRRFTPRPPPGRVGFTVGFTGSLKAWHGVATLVDALALLRARDPSYRLLIVGDGPERERLEARARSALGPAGVEFTGAVAMDRVPTMLARMNLASAPYGTDAGDYFSPLKLVEYLAAALPVVATRVPPAEQVISDGVTGVLCAPDDPAALADAIAAVRARHDRGAGLGRAGRRWVEQNRTWDQVVERSLATVGRA